MLICSWKNIGFSVWGIENMKKTKKIVLVAFVLVAVSIFTALTYFYVKGSLNYQTGGTTAREAVQENEQQENGANRETSTQYVVITQPEAASNQQGSASKPQGGAVQNTQNSTGETHISFTTKNSDPLSNEMDFDSIATKYAKAIEVIEKGYKSLQSKIDLSDFGITYDEFRSIIKYLSINHSYYYVKSTYNYSISGDHMAEYNPEYFWSAKDIENINKQIDSEVNRIAAEAESLKTDIEKFLFIHNSLILNITYGAENTDRDNNLYGAFVLKNTLCTGYSEAFCQIAAKLGLKAWVVTSDKLGHAWNIVLLDGRYYFVDCAWDDPIMTNQSLMNNPVSGYGRYQYFMCSEEYLYKNDHESKDWTVNGINVSGLAASKFYDGFFWRNYETLMMPSLGSWYQNYSYQTENVKPEQVKFSIDKITFSNNENYTLDINRTIYTYWKVDNSYYPVFYSTLQSYDGAVYYIRANGIYKINEGGASDGSKDTCVFKNPRNDNIFDFYIDKADKTFTVMYGKTMDNNASNATKTTYNISDYKF